MHKFIKNQNSSENYFSVFHISINCNNRVIQHRLLQITQAVLWKLQPQVIRLKILNTLQYNGIFRRFSVVFFHSLQCTIDCYLTWHYSLYFTTSTPVLYLYYSQNAGVNSYSHSQYSETSSALHFTGSI